MAVANEQSLIGAFRVRSLRNGFCVRAPCAFPPIRQEGEDNENSAVKTQQLTASHTAFTVTHKSPAEILRGRGAEAALAT